MIEHSNTIWLFRLSKAVMSSEQMATSWYVEEKTDMKEARVRGLAQAYRKLLAVGGVQTSELDCKRTLGMGYSWHVRPKPKAIPTAASLY